MEIELRKMVIWKLSKSVLTNITEFIENNYQHSPLGNGLCNWTVLLRFDLDGKFIDDRTISEFIQVRINYSTYFKKWIMSDENCVEIPEHLYIS